MSWGVIPLWMKDLTPEERDCVTKGASTFFEKHDDTLTIDTSQYTEEESETTRVGRDS